MVFKQIQGMWYDKEYLEISMKSIQNIYWRWIKYNCSINSKMSTEKWICQSIHLYNKIHGMSYLSLFVTHVVFAIMSNLNYIMTHSFGLVKHFVQIHLLPQLVLSYMKPLYERDSHEIFYNKRCVDGKKCDHCGNIALFHQREGRKGN